MRTLSNPYSKRVREDGWHYKRTYEYNDGSACRDIGLNVRSQGDIFLRMYKGNSVNHLMRSGAYVGLLLLADLATLYITFTIALT